MKTKNIKNGVYVFYVVVGLRFLFLFLFLFFIGLGIRLGFFVCFLWGLLEGYYIAK